MAESEIEATTRERTHANFPKHRHTAITFSRQVLNLLCKVNILLPVERLVRERVMRVGDG